MKAGDQIILKNKNKFVKGREVTVIKVTGKDYTVRGLVPEGDRFVTKIATFKKAKSEDKAKAEAEAKAKAEAEAGSEDVPEK